MPTAIAVTSADLVLPPTDQQTPTAAVLPAPESRPLASAVADLQLLLDRYGHVIVLCPTALPRPAEQRLHAIRSLLESDRIALVRTDLPPLGTAVLARQLRQLSACDFSPGVVASAARLLTHYIYAGAVLGSVAKLDRVPVGLKSHVKGWLPGAQFAVLAGPVPQLVRIGAGVAPPAGPEFATQLVLARGQLQTDWPTGTLAPTWQVQAVHEAPLPAESPRWWGTGRLVEFTAYLPDIAVLHRLVASVRRETCHWCRMELIGDRCGFCSAPWVAPPAVPAHQAALAQHAAPAQQPAPAQQDVPQDSSRAALRPVPATAAAASTGSTAATASTGSTTSTGSTSATASTGSTASPSAQPVASARQPRELTPPESSAPESPPPSATFPVR